MIKITRTMLENSLFESIDLFILWLQHLHGCPPMTLMHTIHFLFIWSLLTWHGKKDMPMYLQPRRFNARKGGKTSRSRTSARVKALVMVPYWIHHRTTGMADQRRHKTPTLAMVAPHLRQQGNRDRRADKCILLKGEDTTQDDFALCSFSVSWFLFAQNSIYSYNRDIIPFLCAEFGLFHCWYIFSKGEIISYLSDNLSPHIFYWANQFWWDWTLYIYRLGILSIVRLNERLWRSEFHPCISCLVSCFSSDLNFWILHPSRDFPPIGHFAAIDRALHAIVEK